MSSVKRRKVDGDVSDVILASKNAISPIQCTASSPPDTETVKSRAENDTDVVVEVTQTFKDLVRSLEYFQ